MARVLPPPSDPRRSNHNRIPSTSSSSKDEIWSTLLSAVASGKKIPEKRLLVLGGTPDSQREFIDSLAPPGPAAQQQQQQHSRRHDRLKQSAKPPPLANRFALGYTYRDVHSADGEDTLARTSIYTLAEPAQEYSPLLTRLMGAEALRDTVVAILLDWGAPWGFMTELRGWVRLLRKSMEGLGAEEHRVAEENDERWRRWRDKEGVSVPLGPGEYDEPLGVPVVVVCQNTHKVEKLEKELGYKEADFDYVLQFLRTVGLKHGTGLVYTMPQQPGQVRALIHHLLQVGESLPSGGQSKDAGLKHNVIDRDRVFVPPGWDSWGKIRVLREGFDIEGVSRAWGVDIQDGTPTGAPPPADDDNDDHGAHSASPPTTETLYAARISNPKPPSTDTPAIEVHHTPDQTFLAAQLERLSSFLADDAAAAKQGARTSSSTSTRRPAATAPADDRPSMADTLGPVQFNMGGIQYDADEALRRIKERTTKAAAAPSPAAATPEKRGTRESTPFTPGSPPLFEPGKDIPVESLGAYFASLVKGRGSGSVVNSPRGGSGAGDGGA